MGGNYEKGMCNQLMEVMDRFHIPAEYRSDVTYGANVKPLAVSPYSEGVMSNDRITAFLNAADGDEPGLSEGSVYGFCKKLAQAAGFCRILRFRLTIIFRGGISGRQRTVGKWQVVSERTADMKCIARS